MSGDGGPDSGADKRPRVIIEGVAREVASAPAPESGDGPAGDAKPKPKPKPAAARKPDQAKPPAPSSGVWRERAMVAAIAAVTAVVALIAMVALLRFGSETTAGWVRTLGGVQSPDAALATLDERIEALRARVSTIERIETRVSALESRAEQFDTRVSAAEAAGADATREAEASGQRLSAAEQQLTALGGATSAAVRAVDEVRADMASAAESGASATAVATRLARETARIDGLERRIGGLEAAPSLAQGGDGDVAARLAALETALAAKEAATVEAVGPDPEAAYRALADRADEGEPFAGELSLLGSLLGEEPALANLEPFAARGVPSRAQLAARLGDLSAPGSTADEVPEQVESLSFFDRLIEKAGRAIIVRRIGADGADDDLAKARTLIEGGEVAGSVEIVRGLEPADAREAWIKAAEERLVLDAALAALSAAIDARPAGAGAGAGTGTGGQ